MLVRQVREDRRVIGDARDPLRGEPVGAGLDHDRLLPGLDHLAQDRLQVERAGRGVGLLVAPQLVADPDADRADEAGSKAGGFERRPREERGRGLAIGAGDPDDGQLVARIAEPPRRRRSEGLGTAIDDDLRQA